MEHLLFRGGVTIWMNTKKGVFCKGPQIYPQSQVPEKLDSELRFLEVPSTLDMLEETTSARFFCRLKAPRNRTRLDSIILQGAIRFKVDIAINKLFVDPARMATVDHERYSDCFEWPWHNRMCHSPDEVASLRLDTVYSRTSGAIAVWPEEDPRLCNWYTITDSLTENTMMPNGLTRFKLNLNNTINLGGDFVIWNIKRYDECSLLHAWLLQFPRISTAVDARIDDSFVIIDSLICLAGNLESWCPALYDGSAPSIFLFLAPAPKTVADHTLLKVESLSFWSYDETGQSRMLENEREHWGLPVLSFSVKKIRALSWPDHVYKSLYTWQKARGFDPSTAGWAREMGYPELKIVKEKSRFEEVDWDIVEKPGRFCVISVPKWNPDISIASQRKMRFAVGTGRSLEKESNDFGIPNEGPSTRVDISALMASLAL
ncbi:hypothetical protein VNI00_011473 [Paramarasmius palmivorus]|uniref:Uncharacterized protein n=1 Tax=Paramarasmius palmivorus TaxID=297713 RepID=A0AAW0CB22_9AGAR